MAAATTLPRVQLRIPLKALGDDRLARMAAAGDRDALAAIFERHHQALYRYCRGLLGSKEDAQDAVAGAMTRVVRALPGETRTIALKPWLYRIAHNESMRIAQGRRPRAELEEASDVAAPDGADGVAARERLAILLADLAELSERQRGALVLREMEGAGFARIGEVFSVSAAAAKQTVYEARVCLADFEKGRKMRCDEVTRALSDGDRRRLRGRTTRAHLRACEDCRAFEEALRCRPAELCALTPPLPAPIAAALLAGIVGGGGGAGGAGGLAVPAAGAAGAAGAGTGPAALAGGAAGGGGAVASAGGFAASIALPSFAVKGLVVAGLAAGAAGAALERGAEPEGRPIASPMERAVPATQSPAPGSDAERADNPTAGQDRAGGDRAERVGGEPAAPADDPTTPRRTPPSDVRETERVAGPAAAPSPAAEPVRAEATPGGSSPSATQRREELVWRAIETALGDGPPNVTAASALGGDWGSAPAVSALAVADASWPASAPALDQIAALIPTGVSVSELLERGPAGLGFDALAPAGVRGLVR